MSVVQVEIEQLNPRMFVVFLLCIPKIFLPTIYVSEMCACLSVCVCVTNKNERAKLFFTILIIICFFILFGSFIVSKLRLSVRGMYHVRYLCGILSQSMAIFVKLVQGQRSERCSFYSNSVDILK